MRLSAVIFLCILKTKSSMQSLYKILFTSLRIWLTYRDNLQTHAMFYSRIRVGSIYIKMPTILSVKV